MSRLTREMGWEFSSGLTVQSMKATGTKTRLMEEAVLFMLTEMSIQGCGKMIRLMVKALIFIQMVLSMLESGIWISNRVRALRHGLTVLNIREITSMGRSTALESSTGLMDPATKESSRTTIFMERDPTSGVTEELMMASGSSTRCMAMVFSHGTMAEDMKENTSKTRSKAKESSTGLMAASMTEVGLMVNSMVMVDTFQAKVNLSMENGRKARESSGSMSLICHLSLRNESEC
jgi:hypothetical protein